MFKDIHELSKIVTPQQVYTMDQLNTYVFEHEMKQVILILCTNTIEILSAYVCAMKSKHAVMLLSADIDCELLQDIIEEYKPYWIVGTNQCIGYTKKATYLVREQNEIVHIHKDLALLLSTSGTTGSQKFVRLSYENLQSNAQSIVEYLQIDANERAVMNLPLSYSYGLSIVNSHLLVGATILLTEESVLQPSFWQFVEREGATSLAGVPFTYQMLQRAGLTKMNLPALKTFTQAGGRLSEKLVRYFAEWSLVNDKRFFIMYGQTEASPRISYIPHERVLEKVGTIGIAIPGGTLRIEKEELVYEGPNVMLGYAQCIADLTKGDEMNGVLYTGDVATEDEDGYFTITGRLKRFIKLYGLRINLDEIEKKLEGKFQIPLVCTGTDEKLVVIIEQVQYLDAVKAEIESLYHLHKTAYKVIVHPIPYFSNGKTDYMKLKELCI